MKKFSDLTEDISKRLRHQARPPKGAERPSAENRYSHHRGEALKYMSLIGDHMKSNNHANPKGLNWGHVGSMEEIHHKLKELHRFMGSPGFKK